jgi:hypothetical protein
MRSVCIHAGDASQNGRKTAAKGHSTLGRVAQRSREGDFVQKVESTTPKTPSTNPEFIYDQSGCFTRDKGQRPLRKPGVFLDKD